MTATALTGWAVAAAAVAFAALARARVLARDELVARACHELRTPLTAARLALHVLARAPGGATAAAIERELRRADVALTDLCAAREGRRAPDRLELVEAAELVAEAGASWAGSDVRVEAELPIGLVRADRVRVAQVLANLVGNALEHGAAPVRVRVRAEESGTVRFEVDDDGPGLPATVAELIARPRAGRGRRGRGLAIAADIAARHGGRLAAAPASRGARLALELPAASEPAPGR